MGSAFLCVLLEPHGRLLQAHWSAKAGSSSPAAVRVESRVVICCAKLALRQPRRAGNSLDELGRLGCRAGLASTLLRPARPLPCAFHLEW